MIGSIQSAARLIESKRGDRLGSAWLKIRIAIQG